MYKKIIFVLAVLFIAGSVFYYQKEKATLVDTSSGVSKNAEGMVSTGTLGWETYSNSEFGFSFEYPPTASGVIEEQTSESITYVRVQSGNKTLFEVRISSIDDFIKNMGHPAFAKEVSLYEYLRNLQVNFSERTYSFHESSGLGFKTPKYIIHDTILDDMPVVDVIGEDWGGPIRVVYALTDQYVFQIGDHTTPYFKTNCDENRFCPNVVPYERIDEVTDFDKLLGTFTFN